MYIFFANEASVLGLSESSVVCTWYMKCSVLLAIFGECRIHSLQCFDAVGWA